MHVEITAELGDRAIVERRCDVPMGKPEPPVPEEQVMDKFRSLTADVVGREKAMAAESAITAASQCHVRKLDSVIVTATRQSRRDCAFWFRSALIA
ncbi:MAG: hypothetical protein JOY90_37615, partial [Bradyrhizobium sp.]|uniref:hypothetical protein n=1 Tax=Bradyrhizobium sp. TaxID=376 RepID=UPI001DDDA0F5